MARSRHGQKRPKGEKRPRCPYCKRVAKNIRDERCERCISDIVSRWSEHVSAPTSQATIRKYNMTVDQHAALFALQDGLCAICKDPERSRKSGQGRGLVIDHDHETGQVRALLCSQCNAAIGLLAEDPAWLERAAGYARRSRRAIDGSARERLKAVERRIESIESKGGTPPECLRVARDKQRRQLAVIDSLPVADRLTRNHS